MRKAIVVVIGAFLAFAGGAAPAGEGGLVGTAEAKVTGTQPPVTATVEAWVGGKFTLDPSPWVWPYETVEPGTPSSPTMTRTGTYTCTVTGTITRIDPVTFTDPETYDVSGKLHVVEHEEWAVAYDFGHLSWTEAQRQAYLVNRRPEDQPGAHESDEVEDPNFYAWVNVGTPEAPIGFQLNSVKIPKFTFTDLSEASAEPRGFTAVGDTKRKRVELRWGRPPGAAVRSYAIERRVVSGGPGKAWRNGESPTGPGNSDLFERLTTVSDSALKFIDDTPIEDVTYEYRIASMLLDGSHVSRADAASVPGGFRLTPLDVWAGDWDLDPVPDESPHYSYQLRVRHGVEVDILSAEIAYHTDLTPIVHVFTGLSAASRGRWSAVGEVEEALPADGISPFAGFPAGSPVRATFRLTPSDPFEGAGVTRLTGDVVVGGRTIRVSGRRGYFHPLKVNLACTAAISRPAAKVGDVVVATFICASQGRQPLYDELAAVDLDVTNGRIIAARQSPYFRPIPEDPEGLSHATFLIGGPGVDKRGISRKAKLAVAIEVTGAAGDGQLRCTFTPRELRIYQPDGKPRWTGDTVELTFNSPRPVECAVLEARRAAK